jgi:putative hemolysin
MKKGVLRRSEGQLLQSVIEFRETVVKESMVPRTEICSFEVDASYEEVLSRVTTAGHTRWPVYEKNIDNIVGIFHAKDLLRCKESHELEKPFSLRHFLRPAKFVPDSMKVVNLLKEFQAGKAHLAIVVDEYGGTAGIISLEDVLEEIVGDIRDEYDDEESERTVKQIDQK